MSNLAKYGSYDSAAAQKEKDEMAGSGNSFMKLSVGKNVVRIMPPPPGANSPFKIIFQHYINIAGQTIPVVFTCPRMMERSRCKACERGDALRKSGNKADRDAARDWFPSRRVFCNVIDRNDEEAGPKILAFGRQIHEDLIGVREDNGDFCHPITGFDVVIARVGTGKNDTKYSVRASRETTKLADTEKAIDGWLEGANDLDQFARVLSDEEMEDKMAGRMPSGGGGAEKQISKGAGSERKPKSTTRNVQDDAIDGEVDDESDDKLNW
jgi:hypothetical protein